MKETWKSISNYNQYLVSDMGNIFSLRSNRVMKPDVTWTGHKRVILRNDQGPKRFSIHRIVAKHFLNTPSNYLKLVINHLDSNPGNNIFSNLEWTTIKGNTIHARDNGRLKPPIGELNGQSKLTDNVVKKIIKLWNSGKSQLFIANKFNVSRSGICAITQRRRWKHLQFLNKRGVKYVQK